MAAGDHLHIAVQSAPRLDRGKVACVHLALQLIPSHHAGVRVGVFLEVWHIFGELELADRKIFFVDARNSIETYLGLVEWRLGGRQCILFINQTFL